MKGKRKLALLFALTVLLLVIPASVVGADGCYDPCGCCDCMCVRSPGYWMNHPEAWPVEEITIGGVTYSKAEAIELMKLPVKGDKWLTMFPQVVAAKLNVLMNKDCCRYTRCIRDALADADAWLGSYAAKRPVKANSCAWQGGGECLYLTLDAYNNGGLCAPACD
jgi:hypothetical protein